MRASSPPISPEQLELLFNQLYLTPQIPTSRKEMLSNFTILTLKFMWENVLNTGIKAVTEQAEENRLLIVFLCGCSRS